jgi:outer membrane protein assembly factor BamE (lipoprotein component of BamABCDE complex)
MRQDVAAGVLVVWIALAAAGCSTTVGKTFPVEKASQIRPGVTQAEVARLLGQPYRRATDAGEEKWVYMTYTTTGVPTPATFVPYVGQYLAGSVYSKSEYLMVVVTFENAVVKSCTRNSQTISGWDKGGSDPSDGKQTTGSMQACAVSP